MRLFKIISLGLAVLFAAVGLLFLLFPDRVLTFFNTIAAGWGMAMSPVAGLSFFLILASAYMYLVTVLAFLMFRHPENRWFPLLLVQAKLASSVLSLALFLFQEHYLIYLVNGIADGLIGVSVWVLSVNTRRAVWASS